ncbi:MAG: hypothetical protein ACKPB4_22040, partial [Sphaerospermopsis kisseleviana]
MGADGLASVASTFKVDTNQEGWQRRVAEQINKYVKPISLAYKDFSKLLSASVGWWHGGHLYLFFIRLGIGPANLEGTRLYCTPGCRWVWGG